MKEPNETSANEEVKNIHQFDFSLICEYFSLTDRQGPGGREETLRAWAFLRDLPDLPRVADVGCGCGSSALLLAGECGAQVTAVDLFPHFLERMEERAAQLGIATGDKVVGQGCPGIVALEADMAALPFADGQFDVVWSEGAVYNLGYARALELWKPFVKQGGYVAVTDVVWLHPERDAEVEKFWQEAYSEVSGVGEKFAAMEAQGYEPVASFVLPRHCWEENFYYPQRKAQQDFLAAHPDNAFAAELVKNQRHEASLYERFGNTYGYAFFIGRKR